MGTACLLFPETNGLKLEDIDHLFDVEEITGDVSSSKGRRTVKPRRDVGNYEDGAESEAKPEEIREVEGKGL